MYVQTSWALARFAKQLQAPLQASEIFVQYSRSALDAIKIKVLEYCCFVTDETQVHRHVLNSQLFGVRYFLCRQGLIVFWCRNAYNDFILRYVELNDRFCR
jgi:hypothetical protein